MDPIFLEIALKSSDMTDLAPHRDEVEESLNDALRNAKCGEVTGGGAGSGVVILDVEIWAESDFHDALALIRRVLKELKVPDSTFIHRYKPENISYGLTDSSSRR